MKVAGKVRGAATALIVVLAAGSIGLAGCGRGASGSTAARSDESGGSTGTSGSRAYADGQTSGGSSGSGDGGGDRGYARRGSSGGSSYAARTPRAPVPMFEGEPMWSDSRQHTAEENAHYHCTKSGPDIGASSFDDCLKKVHAFLDHPPGDALKLKRERNGDTLIYAPKDNIFAVARRDGAPRTFFKPRDGMEYWNQQKTREAESAQGGNGGGYAGGERRTASAGGSDEG